MTSRFQDDGYDVRPPLAAAHTAAPDTGSLSSNNSYRQVVHTHVPLSPISMIWYRPRAVALMRHGR